MIKQLISEKNVIVCAGSGGVGKTTTAAALGLAAAEAGRRVLVLTIDPARRLAGALGLEGRLGEPVSIPLGAISGQMDACMVDPARIFMAFLDRTSPGSEVKERLLANRLFQELMSTLSESQEFTSLEALVSAAEDGKYDLVILDTPPAQNAIDFLRAPERLFELFQESVTKWFIQNPSTPLLQKVLHRSSQLVMQGLEKITGAVFLRELSDFFESASSLQEQVAQRSISAHRLLASERTSFVLVMLLDQAKLREAKDFAYDLKSTGHSLGTVILNRSVPIWWQQGQNVQVESVTSADEVLNRLGRAWQEARDFQQMKLDHFRKLLKEEHKDLHFLALPEFVKPIIGLEGLRKVSDELLSDKSGGFI